MRSINDEKFQSLLDFMSETSLDLLFIMDSEVAHDVNLQYLSGHPMDATLLLKSDGETALIPWDLNLAKEHAQVDEIIDLNNYNRNDHKFFEDYFATKFPKEKITIGISPNMPYDKYLELENEYSNISVYKEPLNLSNKLHELRATKTPKEVELLRESARIASRTIDDIEKFLHNATDESENDLDFHVRQKMASYGADDISFPSLVGNSNRAYMIHCYPYSSNEKLALPGLGIIDFGAKYNGYCSDITVPFSFGSLSEEQIKMRDLTQKSYELAVEAIDVGVPLWKIHTIAADFLAENGYPMPHSLGHGLGLSEHDSPVISRKPLNERAKKHWKEVTFEEGMVFTIEPGCYKPGMGGTRIENDLAIVNGKVELLTHSRFIEVE